MANRLDGKRALIYGGGTGLGYACADAMIREGAAVFLSSRRTEVLQDAVRTLSKHGKAGHAAGDATQAEDVERVTAAAVDFLGGLDTLVVSAGAGGRTPIFDTDPAEFQRIIDHNLRPAFLAARYGVSHLVASGKGSIAIISSMLGLVGRHERIAYCTAKAGIIGMVRALALDLAESGVRANAICPGYVETELARQIAQQEPDPEAQLRRHSLMHPIQRAGRPEEIGEAAVYLASDAAAFMTGQAVTLDGGYTAR